MTTTHKRAKGFPSKPFRLEDVKPMTPAQWRAELLEELAEKIRAYPDEEAEYRRRFVANAAALAWRSFRQDRGRSETVSLRPR
jgi:CO/xanthine dehydrogenase FAD-binding subunit